MEKLEGIEKQVKETIEKYDLIQGDEKIAVALSGGKDSTSILYILHKLGYNVEGMMIDLYMGSWSDEHKDNMIEFCEKNKIPFTIIDLKKEIGAGIPAVKAIMRRHKNLTGCTTCGIIKRWVLNRGAKSLNADKLVTGHNLDDEAQNVLMNFLKGNVLLGANSSPATGGKQVDGFVQRIKPFFFTAESEIREYAKKHEFKINFKKCPCAFGTYRVDTREWMDSFSDAEKLRIVQKFQEVVPKLRIENPKEIMECERCGEPSRTNICNACKILVHIPKLEAKKD